MRLFWLRSHLYELNTAVPFFWNLEHGKTWIWVRIFRQNCRGRQLRVPSATYIHESYLRALPQHRQPPRFQGFYPTPFIPIHPLHHPPPPHLKQRPLHPSTLFLGCFAICSRVPCWVIMPYLEKLIGSHVRYKSKFHWLVEETTFRANYRKSGLSAFWPLTSFVPTCSIRVIGGPRVRWVGRR